MNIHVYIFTYISIFSYPAALEDLNLSNNPLKTVPIEIGNVDLLKALNVWEVRIDPSIFL
jgi:Leucine-rich repeat (LRR) protein